MSVIRVLERTEEERTHVESCERFSELSWRESACRVSVEKLFRSTWIVLMFVLYPLVFSVRRGQTMVYTLRGL